MLLNHDGSKDIYQIFRRRNNESAIGENGTRAFGRLIATVDRNGNGLTIEYERDIESNGFIGQNSMTAAERLDLYQRSWKRSSVTDAYGKKIHIENTYDASFARYFISKLTFPNGEETTYQYGKIWGWSGSLRRVVHPDGSVTTRTAVAAGPGLVRVNLTDSAAAPSDQKKFYYVTRNQGITPSGGSTAQTPNLIRAVVNGADEIRYANRERRESRVIDGNILEEGVATYVFEGGNRIITGFYLSLIHI